MFNLVNSYWLQAKLLTLEIKHWICVLEEKNLLFAKKSSSLTLHLQDIAPYRIYLQPSVFHTLWGKVRRAALREAVPTPSLSSHISKLLACTHTHTHTHAYAHTHTHTSVHTHNLLLSPHPWEIQEAMPIPADVPEAQASCKHHEMY